MSLWTHISAVIDVDTYIYSGDIKSVVENMLANAPKITGSEGDADIFVNVLPGRSSGVVISVVGDLRDRTKTITHKEWKAFQKFVAKKSWCGFHIRNCACRIQGW